MENCPDAIKAMEEGNCLFGTVDTWLIWVRERAYMYCLDKSRSMCIVRISMVTRT
jgi:glycerol kinase